MRARLVLALAAAGAVMVVVAAWGGGVRTPTAAPSAALEAATTATTTVEAIEVGSGARAAAPSAPETPSRTPTDQRALPPGRGSSAGGAAIERAVEPAGARPITPTAPTAPEAASAAAGAAEGPGPAATTRLRVVGVDAVSGEVRPVHGAHVSVPEAAGGAGRRSDAEGYVSVEAPAERYHVVAAGYWPARDVSPVDGVIALRPLEVRAIYLPYEQLWNPPSIEWALELARQGLISAIVIDIKEEGGAVLPDFATEAVLAIDAVVDPGTDVAAFLSELETLGIYRIARQSVFLDTRLGRSDVETAILTRDGRQLIDDMGLGWTTPFSATARRYNIDIAVKAAAYFEEIQFDYLRFPAGPLRVHEETTGEERSAAVALFAEEAVAALHAVGAAMSIDVFGETAVIRVEDSIGQVLEDLIPHIDYYSPMVYPSTWAAGSFGLAYPAADPETVVLLSVKTAVQRVAASGVVGVLVRPWLQDYRDYGPRQISYGFNEVLVQILATEEAGGVGFMLWDPTLLYRTDVLALFVPEAAGAG